MSIKPTTCTTLDWEEDDYHGTPFWTSVIDENRYFEIMQDGTYYGLLIGTNDATSFIVLGGHPTWKGAEDAAQFILDLLNESP